MKENIALCILTIAFAATFTTLGLTGCSSTPAAESAADKTVSDNTYDIAMSYNYRALKLLDLDQMSETLYDKLAEYKRSGQIQPLKEGVLIALSRPNEDAVLDKVIAIVRSPLEEMTEWENTVKQIVDMSVGAIKSPKDPVAEVTASVVLENLLADFKPSFIKQYHSGGFETQMVEKIAASNLKFSKKAEQEKKLNQMRASLTPSALAQKLIDIKNKKLEEEKEAKSKLPEN